MLTSSRPSAIEPGESVSFAPRMATKAEAQAVTVTSPAASAREFLVVGAIDAATAASAIL